MSNLYLTVIQLGRFQWEYTIDRLSYHPFFLLFIYVNRREMIWEKNRQMDRPWNLIVSFNEYFVSYFI